ncbi:MAG: MBL fold metallo-hydrolase [Heliobacteriaceae bacterium]|jgi:beta-lactamase superfamily II metal-dependent hydrolase|nr:MBL fold metallo-hydrolase [Heliobacteriaceae bacterium]
MKVHFLNVGHGDMSLLEVDGKKVMVDCCATDENDALSYVRKVFTDKVIDYLIITHPHSDHIKGLKDLVDDGFEIKQIYESGYRDNDNDEEVYKYAIKLFNEKSAKKLKASGNKVNTDYGFDIHCLNSNNDNGYIHYDSLVIKITENGKSVLFTGDSNCEVWKEKIMPAYSNQIGSDILHASHHGSRTFFFCASEEPKEDKPYKEHITGIVPYYTVISSKSNEEKQEDWPPHEGAVEIYTDYTEKKIYITGEKGNVVFELNEESCSVENLTFNEDSMRIVDGRYLRPQTTSVNNINSNYPTTSKSKYMYNPIRNIFSKENAPHRKNPLWPVKETNEVEINATFQTKQGKTSNYYSNGDALPKGGTIQFNAKTDVLGQYKIYWQIVNTGYEAEAAGAKQLRGGFEESTEHNMRREHTQYKGSHMAQAYVTQGGVCVAKSEEFVVNIR